MASAWYGTLGELRRMVRNRTLVTTLLEGYMTSFGQAPTSEIDSWEQSLPQLLDALPEPTFDWVQVLLELQMPVGAERADVVLLGGRQTDPRGYVLELKQWSRVILDPDSLEVAVPGLGPHQHPSVQVLNYRGKLHLFHTLAADYNFKSAVFLHNMGTREKDELLKGVPADVSREAPVFGREDADALARSIAAHLLPTDIDSDESRRFSDAPYEQTRHLFDVLTRHANDIANNAMVALAESGIGLTEEQEHLAEEILAATRDRSGQVFITQGGPGSGKTLLAVTLLLRAVQQGSRCVLAIRNNRLQAILKRCFNEAYPGAAGTMMYFEVPRSQTGIGDAGFQGTFDLVICDEAQRMRSVSMPTVLNRAPVCAIFLDETQRLNPPEEGTIANFSSACTVVGKRSEPRQLTAAVRCRGGQPYHDWIEALLADGHDSRDLRLGTQPWRHNYQFEVCGSVTEVIEKLTNLRDARGGQRVAMAASFTESPGSMDGPNHPDNVRIGYPLTSGWDQYRDSGLSIRWLMRPEEYVQFWRNGKSNNLDRVASIYGSQGFESDYVGLIWGRDLVIRAGRWTLGPVEACYDTIDGLAGRGSNRRWARDAQELVRNRYRIFLTRGIKGTIVYCEDAETLKYLRDLETTGHVEIPAGPVGYTRLAE